MPAWREVDLSPPHTADTAHHLVESTREKVGLAHPASTSSGGVVSEQKSFHEDLHSVPAIWERVRFTSDWTSEQIDALFRPFAKRFNFRIVAEHFEDGIAFTIRSDDYFESPVHSASFANTEDIPRELSLFLRGYIGWLRWAADELEKTSHGFMEANPHPNMIARVTEPDKPNTV